MSNAWEAHSHGNIQASLHNFYVSCNILPSFTSGDLSILSPAAWLMDIEDGISVFLSLHLVRLDHWLLKCACLTSILAKHVPPQPDALVVCSASQG